MYKKIASPNYYSRGTQKPEAIVIHIMEGTLKGTDSWFKKSTSQVSSHFGIGKDGEIHQYVDTDKAAWHCGIVNNPTWVGMKKDNGGRFINPNLHTIGIEHEGYSNTVWSLKMKQASAELILKLCQEHEIPMDRQHIIGHYEINAKKPNCPAINKDIVDELVAMALKMGEGKNVTKPSIVPVSEYTICGQLGRIADALEGIWNQLKNK